MGEEVLSLPRLWACAGRRVGRLLLVMADGSILEDAKGFRRGERWAMRQWPQMNAVLRYN